MSLQQEFAVDELRAIASKSEGALEVEGGPATQVSGTALIAVVVRMPASVIEEACDNGFPLLALERFEIWLLTRHPAEAPLVLHLSGAGGKGAGPSWAGRPHVSPSEQLCLFLQGAPEWQPAKGMGGLIERLDDWLRAAAGGRLDPRDAPVHAPVLYGQPGPHLVLQADLRVHLDASPQGWVGYGVAARGGAALWLRETLSHRKVQGIEGVKVLIVLSAGAVGSHWPSTMPELVEVLTEPDRSREALEKGYLRARRAVGDDQPLILLLGTRQAGPPGRQEHVHVVGVELRPTGRALPKRLPDQASGARERWNERVELRGCTIDDDRSETTTRRDHRSPLVGLRERSVAVWGCGALGGAIAEILVRAGVRALRLVDDDVVSAGTLVRQTYRRDDVSVAKVEALRQRLLEIAPDAKVEPLVQDAVEAAWDTGLPEVDLLIDATAVTRVGWAIERRCRAKVARPAIATVGFDASASRGLLTFSPSGADGGPVHLDRLARRWLDGEGLLRYRNAFWSSHGGRLLHPDLGCSSPTFHASYADVLALAAPLATLLAGRFSGGENAADVVTAPTRPTKNDEQAHAGRTWRSGLVVEMDDGEEFRVDATAVDELDILVRGGLPPSGNGRETGGCAYGAYDPACGVLWIDHFEGPTPGSMGSHGRFMLDPDGLEAQHRRVLRRSGGISRFVGAWHTHPGGRRDPSPRDITTTRQALRQDGGLFAFCLVVSGTADEPVVVVKKVVAQ